MSQEHEELVVTAGYPGRVLLRVWDYVDMAIECAEELD